MPPLPILEAVSIAGQGAISEKGEEKKKGESLSLEQSSLCSQPVLFLLADLSAETQTRAQWEEVCWEMHPEFRIVTWHPGT